MGGGHWLGLMWGGVLVGCRAGSLVTSGGQEATGETEPTLATPAPTTSQDEPMTVPPAASSPADPNAMPVAKPSAPPAPPGPSDPVRVVQLRAKVDEDMTVKFSAPTSTSVTELTTTLTVPAGASKTGSLFLWPGLQPSPGGANYEPIGNGVLQPVLTLGQSCAPGLQPGGFSSWWVSGQYVNVNTKEGDYQGCRGGEIMLAAGGDPLRMQIVLQNTQWRQTVTNLRTNAAVSFSIDMGGQAQHRIYFAIELYDGAMLTTDVIFSDTVFAFADPSATACSRAFRGARDSIGTVRVSEDGRRCSVDKIVLRAPGVAATDPAPPGP